MPPKRVPCAALLAILLASSSAGADISGAWMFKVTSPRGEHTAKLTVAQQEEKITGSFASDRGEYKVEGVVKGDRVEFQVRYTGGDAPAAIPFQGKVEGDRMSGQWQAGEASGSWTAEKQK